MNILGLCNKKYYFQYLHIDIDIHWDEGGFVDYIYLNQLRGIENIKNNWESEKKWKLFMSVVKQLNEDNRLDYDWSDIEVVLKQSGKTISLDKLVLSIGSMNRSLKTIDKRLCSCYNHPPLEIWRRVENAYTYKSYLLREIKRRNGSTKKK